MPALLFVFVSTLICLVTIPAPIVKGQSQDNLYKKSYLDQAFVLETSRSAVTLDYRKACSLESLAYRNPYLTVQLLMTSKSIDFDSVTIKTLSRYYPNLQITLINLDRFFIGTQLEHFYLFSDWENGQYANNDLSDALRLLTIYKYGGYYFDLDIIHLRSVTNYINFIAAEDGRWVANGAMHADPEHPFIWEATRSFAVTYRRDHEWGVLGPRLVTDVLKSLCNVNSTAEMTAERCKGFQVLPPKPFYPYHWKNWQSYFTKWTIEKTQSFMGDTDIIGAHFWNKLSAHVPVNKTSNQLIAQLARNNCPLIYDIAPDQF